MGGVLFTDNTAIGLPLGIERVIGIGSYATVFLTVDGFMQLRTDNSVNKVSQILVEYRLYLLEKNHFSCKSDFCSIYFQ